MPHERGVSRSSRTLGSGSGGRGCAFDERRVKRTAKSCGPDAPMPGVKFARSSRFLGATVTSKLWSHRGEHGISRKPLRREGRTASAEPVCSCAFCYFHLHMRPRVQRAPGLPCVPLGIALRPLFLGANDFAKLGRSVSRECDVTHSRRPGLAPGPITPGRRSYRRPRLHG